MKIFQKRYVRLIAISRNLEELLENLNSWVEQVNTPISPFMLQVSSYFLRKQGSSAAPKLFKRIVASELYRLAGSEDLKCTILLAIIDAYKTHDYNKGSNLINWLSWRIPYITSKYLQCIQVRYIEPFIEEYEPDYSIIEGKNKQLDIIFEDLKLPRTHRQYYRREN